MRSAIDDLLAQLDDQQDQPVQKPQQPNFQPGMRTDIDDLLDHLDDDFSIQKPAPIAFRAQTLPQTRKRMEKCYPTFIGGSNLPSGCTLSSQQKFCCGNLRCTRCDLTVKRFLNVVWDESAEYLFFRNFYTRDGMLQEKLRRADGWAAYCCQCVWRQMNETVSVERESWVCGGHLQ